MLKGYIVAEITVTDPEKYQRYRVAAGEAVARFGGKHLVRGGKTSICEGEWLPARIVVVEFESFEQARRCYDSPEYQAAKKLREGAAKVDMLIVEGT